MSSAAYLGSKCQLAFSYVKVSCRPFSCEVTTGFMGSCQQQALEKTFSGTNMQFRFTCSYAFIQNSVICRGGSRTCRRRRRRPNIFIHFLKNSTTLKKFWSVEGGGARRPPLNPPLIWKGMYDTWTVWPQPNKHTLLCCAERYLRRFDSFETKSLDLRNTFCRCYLVNTR